MQVQAGLEKHLPVVTIEGMMGVGKTALLIDVGLQLLAERRLVFWYEVGPEFRRRESDEYFTELEEKKLALLRTFYTRLGGRLPVRGQAVLCEAFTAMGCVHNIYVLIITSLLSWLSTPPCYMFYVSSRGTGCVS